LIQRWHKWGQSAWNRREARIAQSVRASTRLRCVMKKATIAGVNDKNGRHGSCHRCASLAEVKRKCAHAGPLYAIADRQLAEIVRVNI
jgi:hypothetical protein